MIKSSTVFFDFSRFFFSDSCAVWFRMYFFTSEIVFNVCREGNNAGDDGKITYAQLLDEVCRFANVLRASGVEKGDHVAIYLPMILELPIAMLACARIGAVHSVVFGGFSAESLAERIIDGQCHILVTAGKIIHS